MKSAATFMKRGLNSAQKAVLNKTLKDLAKTLVNTIKPSYHLTPEAQSDIVEIRHYTLKQDTRGLENTCQSYVKPSASWLKHST